MPVASEPISLSLLSLRVRKRVLAIWTPPVDAAQVILDRVHRCQTFRAVWRVEVIIHTAAVLLGRNSNSLGSKVSFYTKAKTWDMFRGSAKPGAKSRTAQPPKSSALPKLVVKLNREHRCVFGVLPISDVTDSL